MIAFSGRQVCGPNSGPQCPACRGFASTRNKKYMVIALAGLSTWASGETSTDEKCIDCLPAGEIIETDVKITRTLESGEWHTRVRIVDDRGWVETHFSYLQDVTDEVESPLWADGDLKVIFSLLSSIEAASGSEDEDDDDKLERSFDVKFEVLNKRVDALDSKLQEILGAIQSLKK